MFRGDLQALMNLAFPAGVPRLGFGSGDVFGGDHSYSSRALVEAAFDCGFRYFDTARLYGDGSAEVVLGDVLSHRRREIVLATKVGILPWSMQLRRRVMHKAVRLLRTCGPIARALVPQPRDADAKFDSFRPSQIRRSIERSLKALKTDYVDILLLHECKIADATRTETIAMLDRLKREGKVRFTGIATSHDETVRVLASGSGFIDIVQAPADAIGQQWSSYTIGPERCLITHSALRPVLSKIIQRAHADLTFAAYFQALTGVSPQNTTSLAALLVAHSLHVNPEGVTLFSTLNPSRLVAMRETLQTTVFNHVQFSGLERALAVFRHDPIKR